VPASDALAILETAARESLRGVAYEATRDALGYLRVTRDGQRHPRSRVLVDRVFAPFADENGPKFGDSTDNVFALHDYRIAALRKTGTRVPVSSTRT
jgi:hypothetical protein